MNPGLRSSKLSILVGASLSTVLQFPCFHFTHLFSTRDRCTHAPRGSSFARIEKCQTPSSHIHPPSVHRFGLTLGAELLEEATLSRDDDGTAWSWNPWLLMCGMTECGTTGAGEPQITGVPRVHRTLELDGCGTMGGNIRLGYNGICLLTSPATIHGSPVTHRARLSHHGMTQAKPKNRLMSGAGDSRRNQMSLRQQLRKRQLRSRSDRRRISSRRYRELVLCKK